MTLNMHIFNMGSEPSYIQNYTNVINISISIDDQPG